MLAIEGVLAAISVRSNLDKNGIQDVSDAAGQLRVMPRAELVVPPNLNRGPRPAVFAFGFGGDSLETVRAHMLDACEGPDSPRRLTGACVLGKGVVIAVNAEGNPAPEDIQGYRVANAEDGAWGLFLGFLWTALFALSITPLRPNLFSYIRHAELLDD